MSNYDKYFIAKNFSRQNKTHFLEFVEFHKCTDQGQKRLLQSLNFIEPNQS